MTFHNLPDCSSPSILTPFDVLVTVIKGKGYEPALQLNSISSQSSSTLGPSLSLDMVYSSVSGVAAVENPRLTPNKPKSVTLDVSFYFGGNKPVVAALMFFNVNDIEFSANDYQIFHVEAQVVRATEHAKFEPSANVDRDTYNLVGEIVSMRLITDGTGVGDYPTLIRVLGQCASVNKEADTFVVDANPYTHVLESNGWLSVEASFASSRFATMTKKPFPNPSNTVLVEGFAGNVAWTDAQKLERIRVDVERIAFPNKAKTVSARAPALTPEPSPTKGLRFSLGSKRPLAALDDPTSPACSSPSSSGQTSSPTPTKAIKTEKPDTKKARGS